MVGAVLDELRKNSTKATGWRDIESAPRGEASKPSDLSHALQHALLAGQKGVWWVDYDPTECAAYRRLENLRAENAELKARCDKLEAALKRLSSAEAFVTPRATNAEDRARMEYAEKALRSALGGVSDE